MSNHARIIEKGSLMLKKLFITAAAAAAVSAPLAGVASADKPSDVSVPPGQSDVGPGVPNVAGNFIDTNAPGLNPAGTGNPLPPGQEFNFAKSLSPGVNTPQAVGNFVNGFYGTTDFGKLPPGLATKTFTPGCASGNTATSPNGVQGPNICNNKN